MLDVEWGSTSRLTRIAALLDSCPLRVPAQLVLILPKMRATLIRCGIWNSCMSQSDFDLCHHSLSCSECRVLAHELFSSTKLVLPSSQKPGLRLQHLAYTTPLGRGACRQLGAFSPTRKYHNQPRSQGCSRPIFSRFRASPAAEPGSPGALDVGRRVEHDLCMGPTFSGLASTIDGFAAHRIFDWAPSLTRKLKTSCA